MQTIQVTWINMKILIKTKRKAYKLIPSFLIMINTKICMFKIFLNKNNHNKKITLLLEQLKRVLRI